MSEKELTPQKASSDLRSLAKDHGATTEERLALDLAAECLIFIVSRKNEGRFASYLITFDSDSVEQSIPNFSRMTDAIAWLEQTQDASLGNPVTVAGGLHIVGINEHGALALVPAAGRSNFKPDRILGTLQALALHSGEASREYSLIELGAKALLFIHAASEVEVFRRHLSGYVAAIPDDHKQILVETGLLPRP